MSTIDREIEDALARVENKLDTFDAVLTERVNAWTAGSLEAAPPVPPETLARVARLLAEGGEQA